MGCDLWNFGNIFTGTGVPLLEGPIPHRKHLPIGACVKMYVEQWGERGREADAEAPEPGSHDIIPALYCAVATGGTR